MSRRRSRKGAVDVQTTVEANPRLDTGRVFRLRRRGQHLRSGIGRCGLPALGIPRLVPFHFATGGLELATAVLLALAGTRLLGAALGSVVMLAATATVMVHGEHAHAILPIMILALLAIAGRTSRPIATITVEQ